MQFCPRCSNRLLLGVRPLWCGGCGDVRGARGRGRGARLVGGAQTRSDTHPGHVLNCPTCSYALDIGEGVARKGLNLTAKPAADIMGGDAQFTGAQKTHETCPMCKNDEAYYKELQIRSADEPATTFYCCTKCKYRWNDR